ncbi:hypothetical protein GCM10010425_74600 [Streptomyces spororaveus]|uniref:Transcriptional regulator n=1 Tax=Streptomyces spororaveus TaxID=284039 RepID=A0ABQ3T2S7_9ACTN|nr:hypothetical protein [Streptomyces spororaveus]GHI74486.1 hypothetical protein Sspor_00470 [Streptomyces spororaveus]GHI74686.1 hypothetical protein Sspor_02470 [Streptomyces spororaveus]
MAGRRHPPNAQLRSVRELDLQMSRSEFAKFVVDTGASMGENVGCTARLVAAWEDGDVTLPRAVYRRILTQISGRAMSELGFTATPAPATATTSHLSQASVDRRDFLLDGAGAALALLPLPAERTGRIGAADVRTVSRTVTAIYAHDTEHGSAQLRRSASTAMHTAYQWLQDGSYTERTGRQLRIATGHLSVAAGWLSFDSGRPADARSLYGEALAAARIADDLALEGHAFGCLSLVAKASGRPREAVAAAQGAQSAVRTYGSARMLALMAMREAGGWALLGDADATDRAIVRAHHLYAQGPAEADPDWLTFFTPAELAGLEALARADLDQHERAAAGAEQAVLLHGDQFARNRALYLGDVAIQHAVRSRPEPEAAAEAAHRVLSYLPDVRSDRLLRQLHNVAGALQRHTAVPAVADWLDAYRTTTASS